MTEKRFTWLKKDVYAPQIVITDSLTKKDLTPTDCYELLNELAEENEQLKIKNQKQENLINSQNKVIEELENWFEKWGFDVVNYRRLDQIMEHFLEGDIND